MILPLVAITQRVDIVHREIGDPERRDALDQAWPRFLSAAGFRAVPIPNHVPTALTLFNALPFRGLVLSGGNDLVLYGGDAPERDATESALHGASRVRGLPVIGVCRGMQVLQHACGVQLEPVDGHVTAELEIQLPHGSRSVNSYHRYGTRTSSALLPTWASSEDGVVKAVRNVSECQVGIMWHPERMSPFEEADLDLFRATFSPCKELAA